MANHKSSLKRIRQTEKRKLANRYYAKTARNAVRKLRSTTEKAAAVEMLPKISAMLDKLAKRNVIHKNKAGNLKSKLSIYVNKLAKLLLKNNKEALSRLRKGFFVISLPGSHLMCFEPVVTDSAIGYQRHFQLNSLLHFTDN